MRHYHGIPAAAGLARGKILVMRRDTKERDYTPGSPAVERARLERAITHALQELRELAGRVDRDAAGILDFQCALLEDPDFLREAIRGLEAGASAPAAWQRSLTQEIAEYRAGGGALSARADDIVDLLARVERNLLGAESDVLTETRGAILVADLLTPSRLLEFDPGAIGGIATAGGSPASHVCLLARARAIPMIVGCADCVDAVENGSEAVLDADLGVFITGSSGELSSVFQSRERGESAFHQEEERGKLASAITQEGTRVSIQVNLDRPPLCGKLDVSPFDGVGLVRTEFLFDDGDLPDEKRQYAAYCNILAWAAGRPVTVRLFDAGGDKPIAGLTFPNEANPFLGLRGIRLYQTRPDVFRTQISALVRAAAHGDLRVMVPMVTVPRELSEIRQVFVETVAELEAAGTACRLPPLGMMVEVPSAALMAAEFDADFFSIGTNDLTQYVLAAARDEHRLLGLFPEGKRAVARLIELVVEVAEKRNVEVSVCGDLASQPSEVGGLLHAGVRSLSVAAGSVAAVKQAVRQWTSKVAGND